MIEGKILDAKLIDTVFGDHKVLIQKLDEHGFERWDYFYDGVSMGRHTNRWWYDCHWLILE